MGLGSPDVNHFDNGIGHLTSISQDKDSQNRDGQKPDRACGYVCSGSRPALEDTGDKVMVTGQPIVYLLLLSSA